MAVRVKWDKMGDCIADVMRQGEVDEAVARQIIQRVADRTQELRRKGKKNPNEEAAKELSEEALGAARQKQINALNAALRLKENKDFLLEAEGEGVVKGKNAAQRLLQYLTAVLGKEDIGVENKALAGYSRLSSPLDAALRKLGLRSMALSKDEKVVRDLMKALWNAAYGGTEKVSASAKKIADAFVAPLAKLRDHLNANGANLTDILAFPRNAEHDGELMITGGRNKPVKPKSIDEAFELWYKFVLPRLNPVMFAELKVPEYMTRDQAIKVYLRQLFNVKALHEGPEAEALGPLPKPTGNVPSRLNNADIFKWKDADSWTDYMLQYSNARSTYSMVDWGLFHGERLSSLMERFGFNPGRGFEQLIKSTRQTLAELDGTAAATFAREIQGGLTGGRLMPDYRQVFGHLDGSADMPIKGLVLTLSRITQPLAVAAYLGNVFNDVASLVSIWPRNAHRTLGENSMVAMAKALWALIPKDKNDPAYAEILGEIGAYADAQRRALYDAFPHGISAPGTMTYLARRLMKFSGMDYIADAARRAMREMISEKFGRFAGLAYDQLNKYMRHTLETYGITADDWNKLRAGDIREFNGRRYMTPDSVDDPVIQQKFALMLHATSQNSIVTPGARERATLSGGAPGTTPAFFMSNIVMFKSWGLAAVHQSLGREMYASMGNKYGGIFFLAMMSAFGGYLNLALRSLFTGYHIPEPQSPEEAMRLFFKSMIMGGGFGLIGDLVFGQIGQQTNPQYSIGGPVIGSIAELGIEFVKWNNSLGGNKPYDAWPAIAKITERNLPFHNLIWTRGAMNYLLWFHVQEFLNPGWWERSNRDLRRRTGHARYGYMPGQRGTQIIPGEGPGVPIHPFGDR